VDNLEETPSLTLENCLAIARRRRWWLILPLFLGWGLVVVTGRFIPAKYRSETVIIVQKFPEQSLLPNLALDLQERLQSMTEQILSRTRLLEIIQRLHLYGQDQALRDSDALVEQMRQAIKIDFVQALGRSGDLSAFKVSYSAPSARLAQQVTNELTSLFIEENLRNRQLLSQNTTEFLGNQLDEARRNLGQQEQRLREFKSKYLGELPEQMQGNLQIASGLQARLQVATEALDEANQQKLYLESLLTQYRSLRSHLESAGGEAVGPMTLDEQLDKLKTELADLSVRYTPTHPDVLRVKEEIASTEKLKRQLEAESKSRKPGESVDSARIVTNPAELRSLAPALQIEGQLRANELRIANREQDVKKLEKQIEDYQGRLNFMPIREQQLAAIARDHDQSRANYESLLTKKLQSEMATDLEKRRQGELFRIIDPPNLPQKPYWPNPLQLSLLGLATGAVLGLGITVLMEMVDQRIYRREDLRDLVPAPVLVGIPPLWTAGEQRKQSWHRRLETVAATVLVSMIPVLTLFFAFDRR